MRGSICADDGSVVQGRGVETKGNRSEEMQREVAAAAFTIESLSVFHEEFANLVLSSHGSAASQKQENIKPEEKEIIYEPHIIGMVNSRMRSSSANLEVATDSRKKTESPRQVVRLATGPRAGTPPSAEPWVIKVIAVLLFLNLVIAGLIVSGVRISDWVR